MTDLTERLRVITATDDHDRGCQGREYSCTCGYDARVEALALEAATTLETLTQENARLREAGWRDIESAPKMRTVLLWADTSTPDFPNWKMGSGYFHDAMNCWIWEGEQVREWAHPPTHWMPLPPAPARKALGGGDEE